MRAPGIHALLVVAVAGACARPPASPRTAASNATSVPSAAAPAITVTQRPPLSPPQGTLGTAHPTVPVVVDPRGRWAVLCQARHDTDGDGESAVRSGLHGDFFGDQLRPYLIVGDGDGEAIDSFVRASSDGRWIAFVRGGRLMLRDAANDQETDLSARGAVVRDGGDPTRSHPGLSFAPDGARVCYQRVVAGQTRIVVRTASRG